MNVPEGLIYAEDHEWIKVDGNVATIGITDYAQDQLGDIVFVELPGEDEELDAGDAFAVVESVKAASDIYLPAGGTITEVNYDLEDEPEAVNEDAYAAWIVKVELSDASELDALMDAAAYKKHLEEQ